MESMSHMANLPDRGNKIIPKIFSPLNVQVFKSKSQNDEEKLKDEGYYIFKDEMSVNGFIYHLAGGKIGKLEGAVKLDLIENFDGEFKDYSEAYNSIYT